MVASFHSIYQQWRHQEVPSRSRFQSTIYRHHPPQVFSKFKILELAPEIKINVQVRKPRIKGVEKMVYSSWGCIVHILISKYSLSPYVQTPVSDKIRVILLLSPKQLLCLVPLRVNTNSSSSSHKKYPFFQSGIHSFKNSSFHSGSPERHSILFL